MLQYSPSSFFWSKHWACGLLVPQPGIEPRPWTVRVPSPNHWNAREFLPHLKKQIAVDFCISVLEYHRLGGLNSKLHSPSSGDWKSEIKVPAGLVSPEASPWLADGTVSCVITWPFLCTCIPGVFPSSYQDANPTNRRLSHMISFNLNYLLKGPVFKYRHIAG